MEEMAMTRNMLLLVAALALSGISACSKCSVPTFGFAGVCTDKPVR
jgi:hypothetical protein